MALRKAKDETEGLDESKEVQEETNKEEVQVEAKEKVEPVTPDEGEDKEEVLHMTKAEIFELATRLAQEQEGSKSKTDQLLEGMLRELKDANDGSNTIAGARVYAEAEIDINDYLDKAAVFFCYSFSHTCIGDRRLGHAIKTPYDSPIRFKRLYRYKKPGTSKYDAEMVSMSCAIIRSKKEAEWIRKHSLYGIKYFENINDVSSINRSFADKLVEVNNMLSGMSQFEVVERAKQENVKITADVDDVKKRLSYHLAEKAMKNLESKTHHKISAANSAIDVNDSASLTPHLMDAEVKA